jgi:hypothetical protein
MIKFFPKLQPLVAEISWVKNLGRRQWKSSKSTKEPLTSCSGGLRPPSDSHRAPLQTPPVAAASQIPAYASTFQVSGLPPSLPLMSPSGLPAAGYPASARWHVFRFQFCLLRSRWHVFRSQVSDLHSTPVTGHSSQLCSSFRLFRAISTFNA